MKKRFILLILFSFIFLLTACSNTVSPNPGGIVLSLDEKYISYMPYEKSEIPSFIFASNSNFNTISNSKYSFQKILSGNDDFELSKELATLLEEYKDRVVTKIDNETVQSKTKINRRDENTNKIVSEKLLVDEELLPNQDRPLRVVYDEVAFILLDNGLQLTLEYRRFTSGGITYYAWRYTRSITLYLHFPLMVHLNGDNQKELLILPLPNYTKYSVGPQLDLKKLIDDDTYLSPSYYNFAYPSDEDGKARVLNFYTNYHQGRYIEEDFVCTYLGIDFLVSFGEKSFTISKY